MYFLFFFVLKFIDFHQFGNWTKR